MLLLQRLWNSYCEMTDHDHHTEMQYLMAHHTWEEERTSSRVFFIDFCFPVLFIGPQGFLDFPIANLTYYLQHEAGKALLPRCCQPLPLLRL